MMEIQPREIYLQSLAHYQFITRAKLLLSIAFFVVLAHLETNVIIDINIILSAINCIIIIGLHEIYPRLYRDSLIKEEGKYRLPKAIFDWSSMAIIVWLFISTAAAIVFSA